MAPITKADPNQLISVIWADTGDSVEMPRRLLNTGNKGAQMRYLISTNQLVDPEAPPLPAMDSPQELMQSTIDAAALATVERRLQALEQQPAPILPSDQALANWSMQAARVALSHSEMAALADQTVATVEGVAAAADERLGSLDAKQAALISTVSDALSEAQQATAAAVLNLEQTTATALSDIEEQALASAAEIAAQQVGPQGLAGSGVTVAMELPTETDPSSWAKRWFGRDALVAGDGALVPTPTALRVFRYTGNGWLEGPAIEPKVEMVNAQISALDTGNKVFTMQNMGGAGGSGSGGDPLMVRTVAGSSGGSFQLADASRWAIPLKVQGFNTPTAAKMAIQLTAADGPMAGKNLFIIIGILYEPGSTPAANTRFSEYSVLGDLRPNLDVSFTIQLQPAGAPGGISVSVPAGTNAAAVYMTIGTNTTGATSFIVSGACEWLLNQDNVPSSARGSLLPAWQV